MTQEEIDLVIDMARENMSAALAHQSQDMQKARTGKASPSILDNVMVEFYGSMSPISQVATVKALDGRTLTIQPWEKGVLQIIEKAIFEANLGVTPQNDGVLIRLNFPPLTEERRKEMVKMISSILEQAKVSIRNSRRDAIEDIKKAVKDGLAEDAGKRAETQIQNLTDEYISKAEKLFEAKEKDILTI